MTTKKFMSIYHKVEQCKSLEDFYTRFLFIEKVDAVYKTGLQDRLIYIYSKSQVSKNTSTVY